MTKVPASFDDKLRRVVRKAMRNLDRLFANAPAGDSTEAVRAGRDAR